MKALSLWQPWASAIALGLKRFETRSWKTRYRGPLAIHAAKAMPRIATECWRDEVAKGRLPEQIQRGAIVAVAVLADCLPVEEVAGEVCEVELLYGDYSPGRWAWRLECVRALSSPIRCTGRQGLFVVSDEMLAE